MLTSVYIPGKSYPYLAVWAGKGTLLDKCQIENINKEDILLVSLVQIKANADKEIYVQYLLGGRTGYVTSHEDDYFPLPKGYKITLEQ